MHEASAYLLKLVTLNQEGQSSDWTPPAMAWALNGVRQIENLEEVPALSTEDMAWANRQPAQVDVHPGKQKKKGTAAKPQGRPKALKRPAAKSSAAAVADTESVSLPSATEAEMPAAEDEDEVTLPSDTEPAFEAGRPKPATEASATAGAPPRAVVTAPAETEPSKPKKRKTEAKAKAEPRPKKEAKKKAPGWLPKPADAKEKMAALNHGKCRSRGCPECRRRIGLVLNSDETAWVYREE